MIKYAGAEGAGDLASDEGLKKWYFLVTFINVFGSLSLLEFFKKLLKLIFDLCINAFQVRSFLGFNDTRTTFYYQNIFILPKNVVFLSPWLFYPRNCSAELWTNCWKNFGPIGGVAITIGYQALTNSVMSNFMQNVTCPGFNRLVHPH